MRQSVRVVVCNNSPLRGPASVMRGLRNPAAGRHWGEQTMRAACLALPGIVIGMGLTAHLFAQTQSDQTGLASSPRQQLTQTKEEQRSGFQFTTPLILSAGRDAGFLAGGRDLSDTVTILTGPTFTLTDNTRRTHFSLSYEPEGELFARYTSLNAVDHSATLSLDTRIMHLPPV